MTANLLIQHINNITSFSHTHSLLLVLSRPTPCPPPSSASCSLSLQQLQQGAVLMPVGISALNSARLTHTHTHTHTHTPLCCTCTAARMYKTQTTVISHTHTHTHLSLMQADCPHIVPVSQCQTVPACLCWGEQQGIHNLRFVSTQSTVHSV